MKARLSVLLSLAAVAVFAQDKPKDLNTLREFPAIDSKAEWQRRAQQIHEHVLMSCGLWPLPPKTPLHAKVFDRIDRAGYSIEKVYFQTYPGFYLAGNLYRPRDRGPGPFPAILNPHGHWAEGRMVDNATGSIAARCINFARQGMIAFSYDMVGYNDTRQVTHKFGGDPSNLLWNISLMGLQTWNSIRALDFLESLPDADKSRFACTGESGGGTQTFMLGAVEDRLALQAPIVMVSHMMQGGCLCENAPGLRVDYSNMEIAAQPAPRPQILVAATGDWTRKTMEIEGPSIARIYGLFGARDRFAYTIFDFPHNYNQTSREAVYTFFNKFLLHGEGPVREQPYTKEPDSALRVFPDQLPSDALDESHFIAELTHLHRDQLAALKPGTSGSRWPSAMSPAWEHALQLQHVAAEVKETRQDQGGVEAIEIVREPEHVSVHLKLHPGRAGAPVVLLLARQAELKQKLEAAGFTVAETDACSSEPAGDQLKNFFCTYNRTWIQNGAANIKAAAHFLKHRFATSKIALVADDRSAGAALVSAPLVDAVIADCSGLADKEDASLLRPRSFFPGARRIGAFQGALALVPSHPALLYNVSEDLSLDWLDPSRQKHQGEAATAAQIADFVSMSIR